MRGQTLTFNHLIEALGLLSELRLVHQLFTLHQELGGIVEGGDLLGLGKGLVGVQARGQSILLFLILYE